MKRLVPTFIGFFLFAFLWISGCTRNSRKVVFLNSFSAGNPSGDSVAAGIAAVLDTADGILLTTRCLNSGKNFSSDEPYKDVIKSIRKLKPAAMIVYGEEAVKFVVAPHFRNGPFPVVFTGVRWACDPYGLPTNKVTGNLEEPNLRSLFQAIRQFYPNMHRMTVVSPNTSAERKNRRYIDAALLQLGIMAEYQMVNNFIEWQQAFIRANAEAVVVYLPVADALPGWNAEYARAFVARNIKQPVITSDFAMMRFSVFGIAPNNREQGEWAARTVLAVLSGTPISRIPIRIDSTAMAYYHPTLAERIRLKPHAAFLNNVRIVP
ncbi:MAG TPA: ABC transporter substrate binding protein [bacterium]